MKILNKWLISLALIASGLSPLVSSATLTVSKTNGNASSPLLYGIMFEDINHSGDGGFHGQLLQNNGFQGTDPGLTAYAAVGKVTISQDKSNPVSSTITSSLKVAVPSGTTGMVGFSSAGYDGVPVLAQEYVSYFYVKGLYSGTMEVQLVGSSSGKVYASKSVTISSITSAFTYITVNLQSEASPDGNNQFQILFDASKVHGSSLSFGLPQLFPPTYHGRYNRLRDDAARFLAEIEPSFLRFPGGNNLEGASPADRWKWNNTIGPVANRPGRQGDWTYPNTDALGLDEYLQWCEDMGMTPVLAVWSGLTLGGGGIVTGNALEPYVEEVLNELEYVLGSTNTKYGALRAKNGYPNPWPVQHIEVGNEDNLGGGCGSYAARFTKIYDAVHAQYPKLTVIASTTSKSCLPATLPEGVWTDIHHYLKPDSFVSLFNEWDNWSRTHPIFVGEYASTHSNTGAKTHYTNMQGSCGEAVYMIGLERNSDIVKMASYAPLMEHFNMDDWSPNLMGLDSTPGSLTGSTSYYVQKMFSTNRGTTVLPVNSDNKFGPLYWVASNNGSTYYVKLANYGGSSESVTVKIADTTSGQLQMLSGGEETSNLPNNVSITTQTSSISGHGSFNFDVPAWGVAVLAVS